MSDDALIAAILANATPATEATTTTPTTTNDKNEIENENTRETVNKGEDTIDIQADVNSVLDELIPLAATQVPGSLPVPLTLRFLNESLCFFLSFITLFTFLWRTL